MNFGKDPGRFHTAAFKAENVAQHCYKYKMSRIPVRNYDFVLAGNLNLLSIYCVVLALTWCV